MNDLWWGTPKKFTDRMWAEAAAMQALFNTKLPKGLEIKTSTWWDQTFYLITLDLKLNISENPVQPYWKVVFKMREIRGSKIGSKEQYTLHIQYAEDHPSREPAVTIPSHNLNSPHMFPGEILCLHDHSSTRTGWDPARSTAATFGLWGVEWIRAWLRYKKTGSWPKEG